MKRLKNSRGMTTMELIVGVAIASISAMVALNFTLFFYQSQMQIIARLSAEESLIRASYVLQRLFSTAVNMDRSIGIVSGTSILGSARGQFREVTYDRFSSIPTDEVIVGAFHRDSTNLDTSTPPRVRLTPVMITYMRPTPTTSGVIFIANQNAPDAPAAGVTLQGNYDRVFFDKVVEFGLNNVFMTTNANAVPRSTPVGLNIMIKMRHFLKNTDMASWNFCPQWDITNATAGCTGIGVTFVDLLREVRVTMVNQVVDADPLTLRQPGLFERALGNIYVFPVGINR